MQWGADDGGEGAGQNEPFLCIFCIPLLVVNISKCSQDIYN